jgi:hypothetical protein
MHLLMSQLSMQSSPALAEWMHWNCERKSSFIVAWPQLGSVELVVSQVGDPKGVQILH